MNEQEISKWGPEEIANSVELLLGAYIQNMKTDEVLITERAIELLREHAREQRLANVDPSEAINKYMKMLPDILERIFPTPIKGIGVAIPASMPFKIPEMPADKWIVSRGQTLNFTTISWGVRAVTEVLEDGEHHTHVLLSDGYELCLQHESRDKFNSLWKDEMRKREEEGRIEIV